MTEAGRAKLPDLTLKPIEIAADILEALQADGETWENFQRFPDLYKRIRIAFIEEQRRNPEVFKQRLDDFLKKTRQKKMFGVME